MPITEQDIKLYKSSVMLDVPEGGGPMSGQLVPDGVSNNLYPDTSEIDRSRGRVQFRSVFGVAQTANTDTLLGTHALITQPPTDPLVHAALLKPAKWGGTATDYKAQVERYLLKGVRITSRLLDVHYAGSIALQLISMSGTDFPAANEVVVLVHPDGVTPDQYVRALKVTRRQQEFTVLEGGVVTFTAWVAVVELATPLLVDQPGPPASRAISDESTFTRLYSTTRAAGAAFYGIRPLAAPAAPGDLAATVDTVFHPIVPAAQVETPLIDIAPYQSLSAVARTGVSPVTLPAASLTAGPGFVWRMPTAIEAGTLQIVHGGSTLTDYLGALRDGSTPVGVVDYVAGTATLGAAAPAYGLASSAVTYTPGTRSSGVIHSAEVLVTLANSGLSWVHDMEPKPMPGSISVEYMAQGAWYTLRDIGGIGKLSGASTAHGTGSVNYTSGSLAATLGAIPDTDSSIIYTWTAAQSATAVAGPWPPTATCVLQLSITGGAAGDIPAPDAISWTAGTAPRSATVAAGVLGGGATGRLINNTVSNFAPAEVPDPGSVTWTGSRYTPPVSANVTAVTSGMSMDLGQTGLAGTYGDAWVSVAPPSGDNLTGFSSLLPVRFRDAAILAANDVPIGTVDLATGIATLNTSVNLEGFENIPATQIWLGETRHYIRRNPVTRACAVAGFAAGAYPTAIRRWTSGSTTPASGTGAIGSTWQVLPARGWSSGAPTHAASIIASVFGTVLTVDGTPRLGWDVGTAASTPNTGTFTAANGALTVEAPPAGSSTALSVHSIAYNLAMPYLTRGVFRAATAPLKAGSMQLSSNSMTATVDSAGAISGHFSGTVDFARGIVRWHRTGSQDPGWSSYWSTSYQTEGATPDSFAYNAVFLQYLPLDPALLGLDTSRLPLDGRVPYVRNGDTVVVHHTLTTTMPNPVTLGAVQSLGRTRIAAVKVVDFAGAKVASDRYTTDLDAGTITFTESLAAYAQPLTVHHRIEDVMLASKVDISGAISFTRPLTHTFPADTSYLSSALLVGDVQARAFGQFEQEAWTGEWADAPAGPALLANYNEVANPIGVTNAGAIPERWACIFTSSTTFRVVGESVGEIATTASTGTETAPINPATMAPYFTLASAGWGTGWAAGNVMRFNTEAAGANFVTVRTVLQGPATASSDQFTIAFRGDVNA